MWKNVEGCGRMWKDVEGCGSVVEVSLSFIELGEGKE
jgi:hypothetical protein